MKLFALLLLLFISHAAALWPIPRDSYTNGSSVVWLAEGFRVTYNGQSVRLFPSVSSDSDIESHSEFWKSQTEQEIQKQLSSFPLASPAVGSFSSKDIVAAAMQRASYALFSQSFVPWKLHPRNSQFEPSAYSKKTYVSSLAITQTGTDNATTFKPLDGQVDESYELNLGADGKATISAVSSTGVLRALETFTQLFYQHSQQGAGIYTPLAPVAIKDSPRFEHRGLNLDVSRNWYPVSNILRTIDALSWSKFNRLHIHMTDAQSWPIDVPALPNLSKKGAYQTGLSYSPQDIAQIQSYAIYRGIEVIIEFDTPGHTSSIAYAYPDLIAAFDAQPWDTYCAEPPCGSLKLNSSDVTKFIDTLLGDVLPRVKPYSSYFHTGGDEVNVNAYLLDDTVKSNETSVLTPLLQKFVDNAHAQVRKYGLTPIVWEEMITTWNLTLGKDVLVQTWIGQSSIATVTGEGYKALFGGSDFWYLDCGKGQWLDFHNGASFQEFYPFADYCSPTKNWRLVYAYDPLAGLTPEQANLVIGGEVHIWSEQTDPVNLDDMVWPRAAAAGEILWSGGTDSTGQNRSQLDASPRLAEHRERLLARGIHCGPVQMVFCTQLNSTECSL